MGTSSRRLPHLLLAFLVGVTAGCGRSNDKAVTQVAARVNSQEITVHQINYLLARTPNVTRQNEARVKRGILDRLIDEELARQQAVKNKLDRSPDVVEALQLAKTEVLAHSYLRGIAARQPKPTNDEVKGYYAAHPELFAKRRIFNVDEIVFNAEKKLSGALRDELSRAHSMQDVTKWLKMRGIKFSENRVVRTAEQVPLEVLPKLQAMKDGQIELVGADKGRFHLVQLVESKSIPVNEATAAPKIIKFLVNQRVSAAIAKELARIRKQSNIQYVGEFAVPAALGDRTGEIHRRSADKAATSGMDKGVKELLK